MNSIEITELLSSNDFDSYKKAIKKKNEENEKLKLNDIFNITFVESYSKIKHLKILKEGKLSDKFLNDINRYLKYENEDEFGIITVNPFLLISEQEIEKQVSEQKLFISNIIVVVPDVFQELVDQNFNIKIFENNKATENINTILNYGLESNASDIYIKTTDKQVVVQFRIDEFIVTHKEKMSFEVAESLKNALAENSGEDSKKKREIKGVYKTTIKGVKKNFRVSIIFDIHGYQIVIRIPSTMNNNLTLEKLGYLSQDRDMLHKITALNGGLNLVCGITGSGKTTTLAVLLKDYYNKVGGKICTIEDPVEIPNPNFTQQNINTEGDPKYFVTYETAIKGFLRQKPDKILVGEMRSKNEADGCITATLSGHTTFSTMHSSSIQNSLKRIKGLGVFTDDLNNQLRFILVQALKPKLCSCKIKDEEGTKKFIESKHYKNSIFYNKDNEVTLYKRNKSGCPLCTKGKAGIKGKVNFYELGCFKDTYNGDYSDLNNALYYHTPFKKLIDKRLLDGEIPYDSDDDNNYLSYLSSFAPNF